MITQKTLDFFAGPVISSMSTANAKLEPWFTRTMLIESTLNATTLDIFFPRVAAARPLADLSINNRAAVIVADTTNFLARQFKGKIVKTRDATKDDLSRLQALITKLMPIFQQFWGQGAADGWNRYLIDPAVCVTMEIETIFDQTPKPGAGARIV